MMITSFRVVAMSALLAVVVYASPALSRQTSAPPAPDYAQTQSWAAYPGRSTHAEDTPEGVERGDERERERVDVFFIHPTTYLTFSISNARYDEPGPTRWRIDNGVLRFQASVFNGCCRIFAPLYRQASLPGIMSTEPAGFATAALAYSDVLRAFDYYLAHENHGRPFIIAGHSQGSIHAIRLLQERIIGTPLAARMIAAYVPGSSLPQDIEHQGLPICKSATMTGCVADWNSDAVWKQDEKRTEKAVVWWDGHYQPVAGQPLVCVNPLNWENNGTAPASANRGAVYSDGPRRPIPAPLAGATSAACEGGLLRVQVQGDQRRHFSDALTLFGVYHDFDYSLYYMNIRENVAQRIRSYRAAHPNADGPGG